jgi:hypothetical protein
MYLTVERKQPRRQQYPSKQSRRRQGDAVVSLYPAQCNPWRQAVKVEHEEVHLAASDSSQTQGDQASYSECRTEEGEGDPHHETGGLLQKQQALEWEEAAVQEQWELEQQEQRVSQAVQHRADESPQHEAQSTPLR